MPAVPPKILVRSILDAIQLSGGTGFYASDSYRTHPRQFICNHHDQSFSIWIYIWTLTHGGRITLPDEYRIQMTAVNSPLPLNPNGYTLLLGYYQDLNVMAGFDLLRHRTFTIGSPSVQIHLNALTNAVSNGMGFATKDNQEIAVGIRPDWLC